MENKERCLRPSDIIKKYPLEFISAELAVAYDCDDPQKPEIPVSVEVTCVDPETGQRFRLWKSLDKRHYHRGSWEVVQECACHPSESPVTEPQFPPGSKWGRGDHCIWRDRPIWVGVYPTGSLAELVGDFAALMMNRCPLPHEHDESCEDVELSNWLRMKGTVYEGLARSVTGHKLPLDHDPPPSELRMISLNELTAHKRSLEELMGEESD